MKELSSLVAMTDAALSIEKLRVSSEIRQSHLARQERHDPDTDELHRRLKDLESFVDDRVAHLVQNHPAYPWFSRVKGVGRENIAKVVGLIDIENDHTISSLWKFAGFSVEDGAAPKRRKGGGKLEYNSQLRSMCWRLGSALLKAGLRKQCGHCKLLVGEEKIKKNKGKCPDCGSGNFKTVATTKFSDYYRKEKDKYYQKYENQGVKIVPATSLPKDKDGKRYEPDDMKSEGHIHMMALRKMIKLFLAGLWVVWREAEGMPVTKPYALDKLGHDSYIDPWSLLDR